MPSIFGLVYGGRIFGTRSCGCRGLVPKIRVGGHHMTQDRTTGTAANLWGRETARRITAVIGAHPVNKNSNECLWKGRRFLIKSANPRVTSVGVSYKMIERLHAVLGAFRKSGSTFALYELDPKICSNNMTPTRSKGPSKNRVEL